MKNPINRAYSKFQKLMYRLTHLLRSVYFGFGKKLKKAPRDAVTTNALLRSKSMKGKTMEEEVDKGKEIKAIPSVAASVSNLESQELKKEFLSSEKLWVL